MKALKIITYPVLATVAAKRCNGRGRAVNCYRHSGSRCSCWNISSQFVPVVVHSREFLCPLWHLMISPLDNTHMCQTHLFIAILIPTCSLVSCHASNELFWIDNVNNIHILILLFNETIPGVKMKYYLGNLKMSELSRVLQMIDSTTGFYIITYARNEEYNLTRFIWL